MNALSRFIIRLLSPKPGPGQILIYPHLAKDKTGIPNPRKSNLEIVIEKPLAERFPGASSEPLPGQLELDTILKNLCGHCGATAEECDLKTNRLDDGHGNTVECDRWRAEG